MRQKYERFSQPDSEARLLRLQQCAQTAEKTMLGANGYGATMMFSDDRSTATSGPIICGHRGAPVVEPENTMASFRAALEHGATWVEFDVRPTADGQLIIHHDADTVSRQNIATTRASELDDTIPAFRELATGLPMLGLDIEMKTDDIPLSLADFADLVLSEIDQHCSSLDRIVITSFDADALVEVRARRSDIATGLLYWEGEDDEAIARAVADGHAAIAPSIKMLSQSTMDKAHAASLAVMTWTVNKAVDVTRASTLGVDMIIGDDPRVISEHR